LTGVLRERRWVAGHVIVAVMAGLFVALGFWQLARHREKQDKVRAAEAAWAAPAPDLIGAGTLPSGTRVQAAGSYDRAHEVLLRQSRGDDLGVDVLTPLRLDDDSVVLVDRGWVRATSLTEPPAVAPPPAGPVVVRGLANASRPLTPRDSVREIDGRLSVPRVDTARIAEAVGYALRPVWIEAQFQDPAPAAGEPALPVPAPPDQVNHLHYAIQWFALALIPLVGWPIVLLRVRRSRRAER
jgi:cytochrome oxidase assembly protein ShyY1